MFAGVFARIAGTAKGDHLGHYTSILTGRTVRSPATMWVSLQGLRWPFPRTCRPRTGNSNGSSDDRESQLIRPRRGTAGG